MALITCKYCGGMVSTKAYTCPHCKRSLKENPQDAQQEPPREAHAVPLPGEEIHSPAPAGEPEAPVIGPETPSNGPAEGEKASSQREYIEKESTAPWKRWAVAAIVLALVGGIGWLGYDRFYAGSGNASESGQIQTVDNLMLSHGLCRFEGTFSDREVLSGTGEATFADGGFYRGEVVCGKMETAKGFFRFANGDTYEGSFVDDHFSNGTYTVKENGEHFTGLFDQDGSPAKGTWYDASGKTLQVID